MVQVNLSDPLLGEWSAPITIVDGRVDGVQVSSPTHTRSPSMPQTASVDSRQPRADYCRLSSHPPPPPPCSQPHSPSFDDTTHAWMDPEDQADGTWCVRQPRWRTCLRSSFQSHCSYDENGASGRWSKKFILGDIRERFSQQMF